MKKTFFKIIIALFVALLTAVYLYDVIYKHTPFDKNLFKFIAILCILVIAWIRISFSGNRRPLDFYEDSYADDIGNAFEDSFLLRKKLLCALRLYNEGNYGKAIKYLQQLLPVCRNSKDESVVLLFLSLCYTDIGYNKTAIDIYNHLLETECDRSRVYNNLGCLYIQEEAYESAIDCFNKSLFIDPENAFSYNNIASCNFRLGEYDKAIRSAETALKKNPGMKAACSLLAIVYHLTANPEQSAKYFQMAVAAGTNAEELKSAIRNYEMENEESTEH